MPKRRRERDRPKAAHDALYNPNKRVLLSYESDEEVEEHKIAATENPGLERLVTDSSLEAEVEKEDLSAADSKGVRQSSREGGAEEADDKAEEDDLDDQQPRTNDDSLWNRPISKNAYTGQWAAIGSLSYQYEDEEEQEDFESEEEDAMAYLRAVRSERQAMPDFFAAQQIDSNEHLYNIGIGDTRGHYEDGAYIAAPIVGPTLPHSAKTQMDPQEAFAGSLKERFLRQREALHVSPSPEAVANLEKDLLTSLPKNTNKTYGHWLRLLNNTAPRLDQIRLIDQPSVMRVLELVQRRFLILQKDITPITSAWIWSLLARLDDVGVMDSDQVASLRDFGKRAVLIQLSFRDPEAAAELERIAAIEMGTAPTADTRENTKTVNVAMAEDGDVSKPAPEGDVPDATNPNLANEESKRANTLAILDSIIVLVGDVFGQRDLLELRQPWTTEGDSSEDPDVIEAADPVDDVSGPLATAEP